MGLQMRFDLMDLCGRSALVSLGGRVCDSAPVLCSVRPSG